jgi:AraC-like DNA-binding protein
LAVSLPGVNALASAVVARPSVSAGALARASGSLCRASCAPCYRRRSAHIYVIMDPLSDVLRAVRLDGAFFYVAEATGSWSLSVLPALELVPRPLPAAEHLMAYHIMTVGTCWAGLEGEEQYSLEPGDAVVFPQGDAHFVSSQRGRRVDPARHRVAPDLPLRTVRVGAVGGERASLVCGFLGCDARPYNPLVAALPRILVAKGIACGWLAEFPRQVVTEAWHRQAGGATMLTRMAELMFVEVVRRYMEELPPTQRGWLAGLRDAVVAPALAALHARPAYPWTLAELARAAATSRTVLAERFSQTVGLPPMQYLTEWRLQLAAERLATGSAKVAAIGADVGYESEAAFSRAFKRMTGHSPAAWRRLRRTEAPKLGP